MEKVLTVGPMTHGGSCIARIDGRVVFVRFAIPGEQVRVRLDAADPKASLWRAEVLEVLAASPQRRVHPWPAADALGNSGTVVGGADYGHIVDAAQRRIKADVFAETLQRMKVEPTADIPAEATFIPGAQHQGMGWRSRVRFDVTGAELAMKPYRSHELIPVPHMPLAVPRIAESGVLQADFTGLDSVEISAPSAERGLSVIGYVNNSDDAPVAKDTLERLGAEGLVLDHLSVATPGDALRSETPDKAATASATAQSASTPSVTRQQSGGPRGRPAQGRRRRKPQRGKSSPAPRFTHQLLQGKSMIREKLPEGRGIVMESLTLEPQGFWQIHPGAPESLIDAVAQMAQIQTGERVADLYAGAGLFTAWAASVVGETGEVYSVESSRSSSASAEHNFAQNPQVTVMCADVEKALAQIPRCDVVVLDPPRTGVSAEVITALTAMKPRVVVYVSCDQASFARDAGRFMKHGWLLPQLDLLDIYPNTHHLESVAQFTC